MAAKKEIKINVEDSEQETRAEMAAEETELTPTDDSEARPEGSPETETVPEEKLTEEERLRLEVAELEDRLLRAQAAPGRVA